MSWRTDTFTLRPNRGDQPTSKLFLKLDRIPGNSTAPGHADEVECSSVELGTAANAFGGNPGTSATRADAVHEVRVSAPIDRSYPKLHLACATGTHIASAVVTIERYDGARLTRTLRLTMTDVLVDSLQLANAASGDAPHMHISLLPRIVAWM